MSQNPNNGPGYNPYQPNPINPNFPGTAYGNNPQPPSGPNYGNNPQLPPSPNYGNNPQPPSGPNYGNNPQPPSGPNSGASYPGPDPNSNYGQYNTPYAPPPPLPTPPPVNPYDPYAQTVFSPQPGSAQSYPGYPPVPGNTFPPQAPVPPKRGRGLTVLIVVIALLIIIGGVISGVVINNNNQNTVRANGTATAQAQVKGTADTQSTASAQQTTIASTYPFSNVSLLNDPLVDNSKGVSWDSDGTYCSFSGSAYHVVDDQVNTYGPCFANNTNFTNFTFEVEEFVKQGDNASGGGLIFRADAKNTKFYRAYVDIQGNYTILVAVDTTGANTRTIQTGKVPGYNTGLNATNTLAVVVQGSQISFYVNHEKVTTVTDTTYTGGQIGLSVDNQNSKVAEAVFSNAKVWKLS